MRLPPFSYKYQREDAIHPQTGEVVSRYYPKVPLRVVSDRGTTVEMTGLLDSGSDGVVLPRGVAEYLDLDLDDAPPMKVAGGNDIERWTSSVSIVLGRGGRFSDPIPCNDVCIPQVGDPPILVGRDPVFNLYEITFVEPEHRFSMKPYQRPGKRRK